MKGSSFVSLTDSPLPQIFPLAQLLSPKCSHRQRRATSSCESINSWNDTHCVKNILWKKTKTNMDSYTTELKGVLAYWDSPRQCGCAGLCLVAQLCPILCDPMDCSLPCSSVCGGSPDKNTGVGCHALLQGIFPTQGLNPGLPHCRQILYHLSHQGSPIWV